MAGINQISNLKITVLCDIGTDYGLHRFGSRKHFTLCNRLILQISRGGSDHVIAVIIICHRKRYYGIYSLILLQRGYNRIRNRSYGRVGKIHRIHSELGVTAGRTNNSRIILSTRGNTFVNLSCYVKGKNADACGDDD